MDAGEDGIGEISPLKGEDSPVTDFEGNSMNSRWLRVLDFVAYFGCWVPFAVLVGFASLNPAAASWCACSLSVVLLSVDYFRLRFRRFQPMRVPDVIHAWSILTQFALGIVAVTDPAFNVLYFGPVLASMLLFGVLMSYLFHEAYPFHSIDRDVYSIVVKAETQLRVREKVTGIWLIVMVVIAVLTWIASGFKANDAVFIALGVVIPILAFVALSLSTPRLAIYFLKTTMPRKRAGEDDTQRLIA